MSTRVKIRPCHPLLGVLALLTVAGNVQAGDTIATMIGKAYDLKSNELLYSETHCRGIDDMTREILYRNPDEQFIAHKILNYKTGATTPSFVQKNFYSQQSTTVEIKNNALIMKVNADDSAGPHSFVSLRLDEELPVVIDAGFDAFVTGNWDKLLAGERKSFQFPFASRETLVELRISPSGCTYNTQNDQCFRLEMNNWLLRALVAPIELGYDGKLQRLKRYRGLSNIGDGKGAGLVVDIHYSYENFPAMACHASDREKSGNPANAASPQS